MNTTVKELIKAEKKAQLLFEEIEKRSILIPGNSELKINSMIFKLAFEMFYNKSKIASKLLRKCLIYAKSLETVRRDRYKFRLIVYNLQIPPGAPGNK